METISSCEKSRSREMAFIVSLVLLFAFTILEIHIIKVFLFRGQLIHSVTSKELIFIFYIAFSFAFLRGRIVDVLKAYKYLWIALTAFLISFGISARLSSEFKLSAQAWAKYCVQMFLFFALALQLDSRYRLEFTGKLLYRIAVVIAVLGIAETIWPAQFRNIVMPFKQDMVIKFSPRVSTVFLIPHFAATYMAIGLFFGTWFYTEKLISKWEYFLTLPFCLYILGSTGCRAAWLAFVAVALGAVIITGSRGRRAIYVWVVFLFLLINLNNGVFSHTMNIKSPAGNYIGYVRKVEEALKAQDTIDSAVMRVELWKTALRMTRLHPVFGIGAGMFRYSYPQYSEIIYKDRLYGLLTAHNLALNILAEGGISAFVIFLLFILFLIPYLIRPWPELMSVLPFIGVLITEMFDAQLEAGEMALLFWACLAFALQAKKYMSRGKGSGAGSA